MNSPRNGLPTFGYEATGQIYDIHDYDDDTFECAVCGRNLRYVHILEHPDLNDVIGVGCVCASRLCHGYDANDAEAKYKNFLGRLQTYLRDEAWSISAKGNSTRKYKGFRVVICKAKSGSFYFGAYRGSRRYFSTEDRLYYDTEYEATEASFRWLDETIGKAT